MTATIALAKRNRAAGTHVSAEVPIPDDAARVEVRVLRNGVGQEDVWGDATQRIALHLEVQVDGEWLRGGGFEAFGGRHVRRDGKPAAYSSYRVVLPPGVARVARAVLTCDAPIRTRVEIEAT